MRMHKIFSGLLFRHAPPFQQEDCRMSQPRRSSSIVLLRKGRGKDFEVLFAQRGKQLKSFAGAYVFPGGVTEACDGPDGSQEQAKRCGLRELFEEAGVLLATSNKGRTRARQVKFDSVVERRQWQKRVHDDPMEFERLLKEKQVKLATNALFHWCTFITPIMEPRRFYTDFFIVDSHYDEEGIEIDGGETVSFKWISPAAALELNAKGEMPFLPPQYFVLNSMMKTGTLPSQVVEAVLGRKPGNEPLPILPHPIGLENGLLSLAYPGDEEHCDYPGSKGMRHRVKVRTPIGSKGGFLFETNLKNYALTEGEWAKLKSKAQL
jgi:nucleoside diphosphate-linked moiety X motif protein 19